MSSMQKYAAEFIGTLALVVFGCGTAMLVGCDASAGGGYILTALAFGLVIVGMAYCVGNISGCHINPIVSLAFWISGQMKLTEMIGYMISQCLGATAGAALLKGIFTLGGITDKTGALGSNGLSGVNGSGAAGLVVEIILTFFFVLTILGVTSKEANHGSFAGLIIGFTLTLVHIFGIGLTGTSVNPARSLGPALIAGITGNPYPLGDFWVFLLGPVLGSCIAAIVYKLLSIPPRKEK